MKPYEVLETLNHLASAVSKSSIISDKHKETKKHGERGSVAEQLHKLRAAHAERFFRMISLRQTHAHATQDVPANANLPAHAAQLRRMQATLRGMRAGLRVVNDKIVELQLQSEEGIQSGVEDRVTHARTQLAKMMRARNNNAREVVRLRAENVDYMSKVNAAKQVMRAIVQASIIIPKFILVCHLWVDSFTYISPARNSLTSAQEAFAMYPSCVIIYFYFIYIYYF